MNSQLDDYLLIQLPNDVHAYVYRMVSGHKASALINCKNKMKETALHMACMMELSKVSKCSRIFFTPRQFLPSCVAYVYVFTGECGNLRAAVPWG